MTDSTGLAPRIANMAARTEARFDALLPAAEHRQLAEQFNRAAAWHQKEARRVKKLAGSFVPPKPIEHGTVVSEDELTEEEKQQICKVTPLVKPRSELRPEPLFQSWDDHALKTACVRVYLTKLADHHRSLAEMLDSEPAMLGAPADFADNGMVDYHYRNWLARDRQVGWLTRRLYRKLNRTVTDAMSGSKPASGEQTSWLLVDLIREQYAVLDLAGMVAYHTRTAAHFKNLHNPETLQKLAARFRTEQRLDLDQRSPGNVSPIKPLDNIAGWHRELHLIFTRCGRLHHKIAGKLT